MIQFRWHGTKIRLDFSFFAAARSSSKKMHATCRIWTYKEGGQWQILRRSPPCRSCGSSGGCRIAGDFGRCFSAGVRCFPWNDSRGAALSGTASEGTSGLVHGGGDGSNAPWRDCSCHCPTAALFRGCAAAHREFSGNCALSIIRFSDGGRFISGNRCEKGAGKKEAEQLPNLFEWKYRHILSLAEHQPEKPKATVGLPLALHYYDQMPLWHTFFTELGFAVKFSEESTRNTYYKGQSTIPSDTVCYPAKLTHGHIESLLEQGVDFLLSHNRLSAFPLRQSLFNDAYRQVITVGYHFGLSHVFSRLLHDL